MSHILRNVNYTDVDLRKSVVSGEGVGSWEEKDKGNKEDEGDKGDKRESRKALVSLRERAKTSSSATLGKD